MNAPEALVLDLVEWVALKSRPLRVSDAGRLFLEANGRSTEIV